MRRLSALLLTLLLLLAGCCPEPADPAQEILEDFGIRVFTGTEALAVQPWDYHFTAETEKTEIRLLALREQLSVYPAGMLRALSEDRGGLHILLVGEILGNDPSASLMSVRGLQFLDGEGRSFLAIAEDQEATLYHELCHVIEDFLLLRSPVWDDWNSLNPADFSYDLDFIRNQSRDGTPYLSGDSRAFIDTYSMSFPREDRARIMEYAMTAGNELYFESPVMQAKLRLLSRGIREVFGLSAPEGSLPWEQYLKK